jgi:catalase-peroxidase
VTVPFTPGRTDASQEQTDVEAFSVLEPFADAFRNYQKGQAPVSTEELTDRQGAAADADRAGDDGAVGGMRVLNTNARPSKHGVVHQEDGCADQRLLREPARHGHGVEADVGREGRVRGARSQVR